MIKYNPVTITLKMLKAKKACAPSLRRLQKKYEGVSKTFKTPSELAAALVYIDEIYWFSSKFIFDENLGKFEKAEELAFKEYYKIKGQAYKIYEKADKLALSKCYRIINEAKKKYKAYKIKYPEFIKIQDKAYKIYEKERLPAFKQYEKIAEKARKKYQKIRANNLAKLYFEQKTNESNSKKGSKT